MLATFVIEVVLALYTAWRRQGKIARVAILLLLCLASFQWAEYQVCEGNPATHLAWVKFGLIGITMLPALGVHISALLTKKTPLVSVGYAIALIFSLGFIFVPAATSGATCLGNYVLVNIGTVPIGTAYEWYYLGFIFIGILQLLWGIFSPGKTSHKLHDARIWYVVGYLSFTVPMGIVGYLRSEIGSGLPSIMCGFALLFALIIALRVIPLVAKKR